MKKSLLLFIAIVWSVLSIAGCREVSPNLSSAQEMAAATTAVTTTAPSEAGTVGTTATIAAAQVTTQTTCNTTSHPVIRKTVVKTTAKPVTTAQSTVKTTAKPTEKPTSSATLSAEGLRQRVFALVNEERARVGVAPLSYRSDVQACADLRAQEIIQLFEHTRPNGSECFTVLDEAGISYRGAGENIACGQRSAEEVMTGWMNSEGHKFNILREGFTGIAVGYAEHNGAKYWVQLFVG